MYARGASTYPHQHYASFYIFLTIKLRYRSLFKIYIKCFFGGSLVIKARIESNLQESEGKEGASLSRVLADLGVEGGVEQQGKEIATATGKKDKYKYVYC